MVVFSLILLQHGQQVIWVHLGFSLRCHYTVHRILQARILEWIAVPFSRGSSEPRSFTLQVDPLPSETPGKPKNIGVGSLSLLQESFLTQESMWGLLHCREILYQLSYQGILRCHRKIQNELFGQTDALESPPLKTKPFKDNSVPTTTNYGFARIP